VLKTTFFSKQDDGIKCFNSLNLTAVTGRKTARARRKIFNELRGSVHFAPWFLFSNGDVQLREANQIYVLEHIPVTADLILPKPGKLMDWVLFIHDQGDLIDRMTIDKYTKITLRGNGKRIMGYDEPLICDMPFMSLRLTFLNEIEGWVVT
jgi:hypothetical protein